ncbi:BCAT1 [Bugula neritina]|uniref:Branched-chain-amino-acid aminotransferase n=1 Tax=Bugula neritina TaxID=10212 RepID=A0A7J7K5Y5_BUGNE|nr:BCAT1 [Bugula neritina]
MALHTLLHKSRYSVSVCGLFIKRGLAHRSYQETFRFVDLQESLTKYPKLIPPNDDSLKFGKVMTDHMLEVPWNNVTGWGSPTISPYHPLPLDPAAKCLHYALELFEGTKAYCGDDKKIRMFRPTDNCQRMHDSAARIALPTFDIEELRLCLHRFVEVEKNWVPDQPGFSLYIRPTMIGTEPSLGVDQSAEALLYVIASPVGPYFPTGMKPVSLLADPKYVRAWPGGSGNCKLGSNYGPTVMIQKEAVSKGYQQVLWLFGEEHYITECGTMNMFVYLKDSQGQAELVTPPLSQGTILPGVVRRSLLELAESFGNIKVSQRPITMAELVQALNDNRLIECFGAGTACVVCPVEKIFYKGEELLLPPIPKLDLSAPAHSADPLFLKFYKILNDIYYGRQASSWAEIVCDA